jgi:hypothetical protein
MSIPWHGALAFGFEQLFPERVAVRHRPREAAYRDITSFP